MFWNHSQRISTGSITRLVSISGFDQRFYGLFFSLFQPCLILRTSNLNAFSYDTALFILHQLHSKTKLYGFKEIQKGYKLCFFSKENSTILAVGPPKNPKTEYTFASEDDALAAMLQLPRRLLSFAALQDTQRLLVQHGGAAACAPRHAMCASPDRCSGWRGPRRS